MPMNRVQFQSGLSMPDFLKQFGTEAQCRAELKQARWPKGFSVVSTRVIQGKKSIYCLFFLIGVGK